MLGLKKKKVYKHGNFIFDSWPSQQWTKMIDTLKHASMLRALKTL